MNKFYLAYRQNHIIEKRGICTFLPGDRVEIKADTSCVILEINVKGDMKEAGKSLLPYYLNYNDAVTYKEDCKSEKTVNRFLLKHRILTDIAIGSVETEGPDKVGGHSIVDWNEAIKASYNGVGANITYIKEGAEITVYIEM